MVLKSLDIAHTWSGFLEGRHQKPGEGCGSSADFQSLRRALMTMSNQVVVLTLFQTESMTPYKDMYMTLSCVPAPSRVV